MFNAGNSTTALSSPSTSTSQPDPTTPPTPNNSGWLGEILPLPHSREGVKTWLRAQELFPSQSSFPGLQQPVSAPVVISQSWSTDPNRKLSDLFNGRNLLPLKESELMSDWEDMGLRLPPTRPGQGNGERLFVSENVESGAKGVHRVLRIRWSADRQGASCVPSVPSPLPSFSAL